MSTPTGWGGEFLVNSTTLNTQYEYEPAITALADGRFVVAWSDDSQTGGDTSGFAVRAQMFNADGSKAGAQFLVNTTTTTFQGRPTITGLADDRFVIAWTDYSQTGGDLSTGAVRAQVFNADGSKTGVEFLVNTTTINEQVDPTITALADGRFVVAWSNESQTGGDTPEWGVRAQMFNADGSKAGAEFLVNTTTTESQQQPIITALADGRFVVAWSDDSQTGGDTSGFAVHAQMFNADGSKAGAQFLVNTTTNNFQTWPAITGLADDRFVIAWTDYSQTGGDLSTGAVRAQVFNADGSKAGVEFLVNTTTTTFQGRPTITGLADGRFVVAWEDYSQTGSDTSGYAVRAQVFNADGSKIGAEFLVNTTTINEQVDPKIIALVDGRFVVSWADFISGTGGYNPVSVVRARIFDPRTSAVDLVGTLDDDDLIGTIFNDSLSGFFGNDNLRGAAGHDRIFGEDDNDILIGDAGNDLLDGGTGNDEFRGGIGSDRQFGGVGNDLLNGGAGNDLLNGGSGDDIFMIDTLRDRVVEAAGGGIDEVRSGTVSIDLNLSHLAQVENARLTGTSALRLIGSSAANRLTGNDGANTIRGNSGADLLTGLAGADRFVLSDALSADQITDFTSAADKLQLSQAGLPIGNGNTTIDGGLLRNAPGGFSTAAELVIFSSNIASPSITTTNAAAAIGSATAAYTVGATRLFAVDNGSRSHFYRFRAADANALVAPSELTLLADLSATPGLSLSDIQFVL
jgi:Ca2+-binding RTX toxin-like protein